MKFFLIICTALTTYTSIAQNCSDSVITLPMTYDRYLYVHPVLQDTISGRFMFDMGAQVTLLDSAFMARHGIAFTHSQRARAQGYGNQKTYATYSVDTIRLVIGSYTYTSSPNASMPLSRLMSGIDGLINAHFFGSNLFAIDYDAGTFRILPRSALDTLDSDRYERIPFTINDRNFICLPLTIIIDSTRNHAISGTVCIDTGDPGSLTLNPPKKKLRRWYKATPQYTNMTAFLLGASGGGDIRMIRMQAIGLGPFTIPTSSTALHIDNTTHSPEFGAIGNNLLSQFGSIIIDMSGKGLYLPRRHRFIDKDPVNYSGFGLSQLDHWFVNGLSRHPVPLLRGDTVTHIDDQPIDSLTEAQRNAYFCTPDRNYTLTVVRDGRTIETPITNLNDNTLWH